MGSENKADQAWALVASWSWDGCEAEEEDMGAIIRGFRHPERPDAAMQETQILSTPSPAATATPKRALVFDACHAGVVLRAVLFVEAVAGVGAMFATETPAQWLAVLALLTGGVLPATLAWLLVACSLKVWLQRLSIAQQYTAGVLLGTLAGLLACALLALVLADNPPWLACAAAGALLSALLVAGLILRARARAPATTTARLAELQARIRPHFLFNTLNSAIALVRAEPAKESLCWKT